MTTATVICDVCKRGIGSATGLVAHMKSMHPNEWRIQQETRALPHRGARPPASIPSVPPPSPPSSNGVRWEEPPLRDARARTVREFQPLAVELRRHPGQWARFKDWTSKSGAHAGMKALRDDFPDMEFRASQIDGGSALWARFPEEA